MEWSAGLSYIPAWQQLLTELLTPKVAKLGLSKQPDIEVTLGDDTPEANWTKCFVAISRMDGGEDWESLGGTEASSTGEGGLPRDLKFTTSVVCWAKRTGQKAAMDAAWALADQVDILIAAQRPLGSPGKHLDDSERAYVRSFQSLCSPEDRAIWQAAVVVVIEVETRIGTYGAV